MTSLENDRKAPVVQRADYTVWFEWALGRTWVHCDVRRWTPAVRRALAADFEMAARLHGGPLYAMAEAEHEKRHKFNTAFGFRPVAEPQHQTHRIVIYERRQEQ